jgi:hypothetical protein
MNLYGSKVCHRVTGLRRNFGLVAEVFISSIKPLKSHMIQSSEECEPVCLLSVCYGLNFLRVLLMVGFCAKCSELPNFLTVGISYKP